MANVNGTVATLNAKAGPTKASADMNSMRDVIAFYGGPTYNDLLSMTAWVTVWGGVSGTGSGSDPGGGGGGGAGGGGE
jgi:hypothetical protein